MPHFILDCSETILDEYSEEQLLAQIHAVAQATGLFDEDDIKVRVNPYKVYSVGNKKQDFIHVFGYIMQGRSIEQKADLSKRVVQKLALLFPKIPRIAMSVHDFEKATYCNREML